MRLRIRNEDRIFQGTSKQIVQAMQRTAIFAAHLSLDEYVAWCVENAGRMGLDVNVAGDATDDRCASLVDGMIRVGVAERI
jgi:hypothetical protein